MHHNPSEMGKLRNAISFFSQRPFPKMWPDESFLHPKALYYHTDGDASAETSSKMTGKTSEDSQSRASVRQDNSQTVVRGDKMLHLPSAWQRFILVEIDVSRCSIQAESSVALCFHGPWELHVWRLHTHTHKPVSVTPFSDQFRIIDCSYHKLHHKRTPECFQSWWKRGKAGQRRRFWV